MPRIGGIDAELVWPLGDDTDEIPVCGGFGDVEFGAATRWPSLSSFSDPEGETHIDGVFGVDVPAHNRLADTTAHDGASHEQANPVQIPLGARLATALRTLEHGAVVRALTAVTVAKHALGYPDDDDDEGVDAEAVRADGATRELPGSYRSPTLQYSPVLASGDRNTQRPADGRDGGEHTAPRAASVLPDYLQPARPPSRHESGDEVKQDVSHNAIPGRKRRLSCTTELRDQALPDLDSAAYPPHTHTAHATASRAKRRRLNTAPPRSSAQPARRNPASRSGTPSPSPSPSSRQTHADMENALRALAAVRAQIAATKARIEDTRVRIRRTGSTITERRGAVNGPVWEGSRAALNARRAARSSGCEGRGARCAGWAERRGGDVLVSVPRRGDSCVTGRAARESVFFPTDLSSAATRAKESFCAAGAVGSASSPDEHAVAARSVDEYDAVTYPRSSSSSPWLDDRDGEYMMSGALPVP